MCEPVTIGLALSAASAAYQYSAQKQQAAATERSARDSAVLQNDITGVQQSQESQASTEAMTSRAQESMRSLGRLSAIGADNGLRSGSFTRLGVEDNIAANQDLATAAANRNNAITNAQAGKNVTTLQANQRIANSGRPSLIGTGLSIAAGGFDAYTKSKSRTST